MSAVSLAVCSSAGDDGLKKVNVLSGGETCPLSAVQDDDVRRQHHADGRTNQPPGHGIHHRPEQRPDQVSRRVLLFTSRDHQFVQTTANRIMEIDTWR